MIDRNIICPYEKNDNCFARDPFCHYDCTLLTSPCRTWTGKIKPQCPFYKSKERVKNEKANSNTTRNE